MDDVERGWHRDLFGRLDGIARSAVRRGRARLHVVVAVSVAVAGGGLVAGIALPAGAEPTATAQSCAAVGYDPTSIGFPNFPDEAAIVAGIERTIAGRRSSSPMLGMAQYIVDSSRQRNINPLWVVGSAWQESHLGTDDSTAVSQNNFFGMKVDGDTYHSYGSHHEGVEAFIAKVDRFLHTDDRPVMYTWVRSMADYFMVHQAGGIYRPGSDEELMRDESDNLVPWDRGTDLPIQDASDPEAWIGWDTAYSPLNYYEGMIGVINEATGLDLPTMPNFESDDPCAGGSDPGPPPPPPPAPQIPGDDNDPVGFFLDAVDRGTGEVAVWGWAVDPDTPTTSIPVHLYVTAAGGVRTYHPMMADRSRPDVPLVYPEYGADVGFEAVFDGLPAGTAKIEAYAIDSSDPRCEQADVCDYTHLGTLSVTVTTGAPPAPPVTTHAPPGTTSPAPPVTTTPAPPVTTTPAPPVTTTPAPPVTSTPPVPDDGSGERPSGEVRNVQWMSDGTTSVDGVVSLAHWPSPVQVRSVVDGTVHSLVYSDAGDGPRPFSVPFSPSGNEVCVEANNRGTWTGLGCVPIIGGRFDAIVGSQATGIVSATGWTSPVLMRTTVDGAVTAYEYSDAGAGDRAFSIPIKAGAGRHEVCVWANTYDNWHPIGPCRQYQG
jgi:hypothetical protein